MPKQIISTLLVAFCIFLFSSTVEAVVYVDINTLPGGDGNSWCTAYNAIQDGLNDADVLDEEVWVAEGTYYEYITLKDGVGFYGGFTGCGELEETERDQRDWEINSTIIDGGNSRTVVIGANNAIIDGFTIQNGNADNGGGMNNDNTSPTITNCTFRQNMGWSYGGGIYNNNSSSIITNCIFSQNVQDYAGAGIYNNNSSPIITGCTFNNNFVQASGLGGGGYL